MVDMSPSGGVSFCDPNPNRLAIQARDHVAYLMQQGNYLHPTLETMGTNDLIGIGSSVEFWIALFNFNLIKWKTPS